MADDFKLAMRKSVDFQKLIKPTLERALQGGLITVEGNTIDETAKLLDTLAGIDLWFVNKERGMRGIASRIQYSKNWRTFTIRLERDTGTKTEYEKRKYAIDNNYLYPVITYQAYLCESGGIGIAYTKDIIDYIDKGLAFIRHTNEEQEGQASFYVIKWDDFKAEGYPFKELSA